MKKNKIKMLAVPVLVLMVLLSFYISSGEAQRATLYWGSRNSDVQLVQRKLQQWGYYDGRVDGVYGVETWRAVREFQWKNGLRIDGIVGPQTWRALGYSTTTSSSVYAATGGGGREDDVELIARLIHAEARGEPYEGQVAVAAVLLNRVDSPSFPNSISGVIYQPLAFESVANGQINLPPTDMNIRAARSAINGWDPTHGSLFFWNPSKPVNEWIWSRQTVRTIGNHIFAH